MITHAPLVGHANFRHRGDPWVARPSSSSSQSQVGLKSSGRRCTQRRAGRSPAPGEDPGDEHRYPPTHAPTPAEPARSGAPGARAAGPQRHVHGAPRLPPRPRPLRRGRPADPRGGEGRLARAGGPMGAVRRDPAPPPHHRGRRPVAPAARDRRCDGRSRGPGDARGHGGRARAHRPAAPVLRGRLRGDGPAARRRDARRAGRHHGDRARHPVRPHGARGDRGTAAGTGAALGRGLGAGRAGGRGGQERVRPALPRALGRGRPDPGQLESAFRSVGQGFRVLLALTRGRYARREAVAFRYAVGLVGRRRGPEGSPRRH